MLTDGRRSRIAAAARRWTTSAAEQRHESIRRRTRLARVQTRCTTASGLVAFDAARRRNALFTTPVSIAAETPWPDTSAMSKCGPPVRRVARNRTGRRRAPRTACIGSRSASRLTTASCSGSRLCWNARASAISVSSRRKCRRCPRGASAARDTVRRASDSTSRSNGFWMK